MRTLLLALIAAASAAPPPEVDLDDVTGWSARGRALLEGPPGCWELEGQAQVRVAMFLPGGLVGKPQRVETTLAGPFSGRLEDGLWTRIEHELVPVGADSDIEVVDVPLHPMVGRGASQDERPEDLADDEEGDHGSVSVGMSGDGVVMGAQAWGQAANLVDGIIETLDPDTVMVWTGWDEATRAVRVVETFPVSERASAGELSITSLHPVAGGPLRLDVGFPKKTKLGDGPVKVTLIDPQLHLVALPTEHGPLPAAESLSTILGVLGFTLGYEQTLRYGVATPCGG